MKSQPQELTLDLAGVRLAGLAWGPEDAPPVLALHGWLDNAASFSLLAPRLEGFRIVALDMPGHGLSGHRPEGCAYHFIDWIKDVYCAVKKLGWERFSVIGHSMGAAIGTIYAGSFPGQVERLALLDGLGPFTIPAAHVPKRIEEGVKSLVLSFEKKSRVFSSPREAAERLRFSTTGLTERGAEILVERGVKQTDGGFEWRSDPRLRSPSLYRMSDEQAIAFLSRISADVLVLRATKGYPFDSKWAEQQISAMPRARLRSVEGGHHVHLDYPERVLRFLRPFLNGEAVQER